MSHAAIREVGWKSRAGRGNTFKKAGWGGCGHEASGLGQVGKEESAGMVREV